MSVKLHVNVDVNKLIVDVTVSKNKWFEGCWKKSVCENLICIGIAYPVPPEQAPLVENET